MLEIKPIESKSEQEEILARCGIPYKETLFAYKAYEAGELLAAAQFDIGGSEAELDAIRQVIGTPEDFEGMFILGRAVLNFLDLCGVETVISCSENDEERRLLRCIGFRDEGDCLRVTLKGLFDGHCSGNGSCQNG